MPCPSDSSHAAPPAKPEGACRVLHTADWHLGKMLGDVDRAGEHSVVLDALFQMVQEHRVDVLLVAGDVFDSAHPPQSAVRLYFDFLTRIYRHTQCQVVITAGNHDSPAQIDAPRQALHALRVHVVGALPDEVSACVLPLPSAEAPQVVIAAIPFLRDRDLRTGQIGQSAEEIQSALRDGLRRVYQRVAEATESWQSQAVPVIAMGHLTVLGASTSDSERDIHVGGLGSVGVDVFPAGFSYVALGHLHRPQSVGGADHVRYAGSPLALSFSECADSKEARLLDFAGGAVVHNVGVALPVPRALSQITLPYTEVEAALKNYEPPASAMEPWLEVIIQNAPPDPSLMDRVRVLLGTKRCKVLRVIAEREHGAASLQASDDEATRGQTDLLADPEAVFDHRLDYEPDLDGEARARLQTAFVELHNLWTERQREAHDSTEVPSP